ncbi:RuBisCO large subunit C-terminal-like domain-containing protein [Flaviflexus massiliensis]|uniref:RuBisCO large subunit C-terminal-like domain-containing protein n=1 Tax=Flaviflexus massiliensis TaxID=1522309 RepID=UPI0006D57A69|nr:RuBisCO large subunit C-terminal-like domain-containing protein [Flaviflexus massiliensis]
MDNDVWFQKADDVELVHATYLMSVPEGFDPHAAAAKLAVGQTTGTWVDVPGVTERMRREHQGRVIRVIEVPSVDVAVPDGTAARYALMTIGVPSANLGGDIPTLLTTVLGNDASTSVLAKLVELELPRSFHEAAGGPAFGLDGIRELTGVRDRPLLLSMIKPCIGMTIEDSATIFRETALGGADIIKDDEVLTHTIGSTPVDRVRAFRREAERVKEETGRTVPYAVNITGRPDRMLKDAQVCADEGATALMINYSATGYGAVQMIRDAVGLPVLGHFAGTGPFIESPHSGMAGAIATGQLPRLAGSDMAMILTPWGGYPLSTGTYRQTVSALRAPVAGLKPTLPLIGGGVHPGMVEKYVGDLGHDIALSPGGGVHGHPGGSRSGATAMRQAIDAVVEGRPVVEAAKEHEELAQALEAFGTGI